MLPQVNFRLKIAYDGTRYLGWQKTKMGPSIEGTLEAVLQKILQEPIKLQAASRTDAGVHASGQVVNFFTKKDNFPLNNVNSLLPKDIVVLSFEKMPLDFHPTLDCSGKEYHYHIWDAPLVLPSERYTHWHRHQSLDIEKMTLAASHLIGTHDFAAFCNKREYDNTVREITSIQIERSREYQVTIKVKGKNFLYKMVRNIVGTLVTKAPGDIREILLQKKRPLAGITAPAHGLTLFEVFY